MPICRLLLRRPSSARSLTICKTTPHASTPLQQLYSAFFYSPSHIRQLFKEHLGCTPQHYLLQLKATKACELLRSPASIDQVAREAGFSNVRSFQRSFKRIMGVTPSEYRNGIQNRELITAPQTMQPKLPH
ncbi:MAG: helix-turn-helix domain-containing protein [Limnochordia bacterium]